MYMRYFTLMTIYEFPVIKLRIGLFVIRSSNEEDIFNVRIFVSNIHHRCLYIELCYLIFQVFQHPQIPNSLCLYLPSKYL